MKLPLAKKRLIRAKLGSQTHSVSPTVDPRNAGEVNSPGPAPFRPMERTKAPLLEKIRTACSGGESTAIRPSDNSLTPATRESE
jgi:hypothetical protein